MKLKNLTVSGLLCISMLFSVAAAYAQVEEKKRLPDDEFPGDVFLYKPGHTMDRGMLYNNIGELIGNSRTYGYWQSNRFPYMVHGYWGEILRMFPMVGMPPGPWGLDIPTYEFGDVDRSMNYSVLELVQHIYISGQPLSISYSDWEARDFNLTRAMGGPEGARDSWSNQPLVAISTREDSWPEGYFGEADEFAGSGVWTDTPGERHFPGRWARDADPTSPTFGQEQEGQFPAELSAFYTEYDKYCGIRRGDDIGTGYPVGLDMETNTYAYSNPLVEDIIYWDVDLIFMEEDWVRAPLGVEAEGDPYRHMYTGTIDDMYFGMFWWTQFPDYRRTSSRNYARPYAQDTYAWLEPRDSPKTIFFYFKYGWHQRQWGTPYNGPVSVYSFYIPQSPFDLGITSYHWFDQYPLRHTAPGQGFEVILYAMMSGDPTILWDQTGAEQAAYFHPCPEPGEEPNYKMDNIDSLIHFHDYMEDGTLRINTLDCTGYDMRPYVSNMVGTGPFSMSPGDTAHISFCMFGSTDNPGPLSPGSKDNRQMEAGDRWPNNDPLRFGVDPHDRFEDVYLNLEYAKRIYKSFFRASGPPSTPTMWAKGTLILDENNMPMYLGSKDGVTLYWDDLAEYSLDYGTKVFDFQGYRLFKRTYDPRAAAEWELLDQFDIIDGITGWDPVGVDIFMEQNTADDPEVPIEYYMGDDTGLEHSFYDGNVINGLRYEYCLTAYDDWDDVNVIPSSSSAKGANPKYRNFVLIKPIFQSLGYAEGDTAMNVYVEEQPQLADRTVYPHFTGIATSVIDHRIVDELLVKETEYTISFAPTISIDYISIDVKDTTEVLGYSVFDNTTGVYVLENVPFIFNQARIDFDEECADYFPTFDGIGLAFIDQAYPGFPLLPDDFDSDDFDHYSGWSDPAVELRRDEVEGEDGQWDFDYLRDYGPDYPGIFELRWFGYPEDSVLVDSVWHYHWADSGYNTSGGGYKSSVRFFPFQIWDITDSVYNARSKVPKDTTGLTTQMLLRARYNFNNPFNSYASSDDRLYIINPEHGYSYGQWYLQIYCPVAWELDKDAWKDQKIWVNTYEGVFAQPGDIREVLADVEDEYGYVNDTTYVIADIDTTVVPPDTTYVIADIDSTVVPPDTTYVIDNILEVPAYITVVTFDTVYWTTDSLDKYNPRTSDKYIWKTEFPLTEEDTYIFKTKKSYVDEEEFVMDRILAVPNPYVVASATELYVGTGTWNRKEIRFVNLPPECTIDIYTLTGDRVRTIEHKDNTGGFKVTKATVEDHLERFPTGVGEATWDLLTFENLEVSYGMYIYVVKTPDGKKFIEKLVIIK